MFGGAILWALLATRDYKGVFIKKIEKKERIGYTGFVVKKRSFKMKKFRIYYYKTKNFISYKIIDAKNTDEAIKKAKVKYILEINEI